MYALRVFLTEAEAEEVASALRSRIKREEGFRGPGYHLHLEEANGSELTIGVLDEEPEAGVSLSPFRA